MIIGIQGLGLIGGSMAKAFVRAGHTVYGSDISLAVEDAAIMNGACAGKLTSHVSECDFIFIALYPCAAVEYVENNAHLFKKDSIVIYFL